ncbi:MAG: hypothetical protein AB7G93_18200 [Bdellovibrionales bacterium]
MDSKRMRTSLEIPVRAPGLLALISTVAFAAAMGCNGKSPLNRQSDPVEDYKSVLENSRPYVPGQKDPELEQPVNYQKVCFEPFSVSVEADKGNKLMTFAEGKKGQYRLVVNSFASENFEIRAQAPFDKNLQLESKKGRTAVYLFSWTPSESRRPQFDLKLLTLKYISSEVQAKCGSDIRETLNLVVLKTELPASPGSSPGSSSNPSAALSCVSPMKLRVESDRGSKLITFTEDVADTYQITVRSFLSENFEVQAQPPFQNHFRLTSRSGNTATYQFTWTPPKPDTPQIGLQLLKLSYTSPELQTKCGRDFSEAVNLVVLKTEEPPSISFVNLPSHIVFGASGPAPTPKKFNIEINDPASTAKVGPELSIEFGDWIRSGERLILDGSHAVMCKLPGRYLSGTRWIFEDCEFDVNKVKNVNTYKGSGSTVDAVFLAKAQSQRSSQASSATPAYVKIEFPRPPGATAADEPQFGPAASKKKKEKEEPL